MWYVDGHHARLQEPMWLSVIATSCEPFTQSINLANQLSFGHHKGLFLQRKTHLCQVHTSAARVFFLPIHESTSPYPWIFWLLGDSATHTMDVERCPWLKLTFQRAWGYSERGILTSSGLFHWLNFFEYLFNHSFCHAIHDLDLLLFI